MNLFALHAIIGGAMALVAWSYWIINWQVWKKSKRNLWPYRDTYNDDPDYRKYRDVWDWAPYNRNHEILWVILPIILPVAWLPGIALGIIGFLLWLVCGGVTNRIIRRAEKREVGVKEQKAQDQKVAELEKELAKARREVESWVSAEAKRQAEEVVYCADTQ